MNQNEKCNIPFRMLVLITTHKLAEKSAQMFKDEAIPVQYEWNAVGTASSEMIDVLGLGNPEKYVLMSFMPKQIADAMLKKLKKELRLGAVNSGIAFTLPLTGANSLIVRMFEDFQKDDENNTERKVSTHMSEVKYSVIAAIVEQGYSENVMEAARQAGASGGTVVTSRGIGDEKAMGFWGKSIQSEKDMVFIVSDNENKLNIMKAIGEKCGMHSDAKGTLVSLPIDNVIGFDAE